MSDHHTSKHLENLLKCSMRLSELTEVLASAKKGLEQLEPIQKGLAQAIHVDLSSLLPTWVDVKDKAAQAHAEAQSKRKGQEQKVKASAKTYMDHTERLHGFGKRPPPDTGIVVKMRGSEAWSRLEGLARDYTNSNRQFGVANTTPRGSGFCQLVMHHSMLAEFLIECEDGELDGLARIDYMTFWLPKLNEPLNLDECLSHLDQHWKPDTHPRKVFDGIGMIQKFCPVHFTFPQFNCNQLSRQFEVLARCAVAKEIKDRDVTQTAILTPREELDLAATTLERS
ncbi:hypothetical protein [Ferrimonas marina]|uniref:Uncharacterized protein n=1 Tax=Ferrimonas marina TaxID=299255 RepID=A0A1M5UMU4_9GAMM|nr:hypothetical protein [Ferrimonas marina]SHH64314.1 hypothetical protein SAMN02745129_2644 [Ferrimonas marina]